MIEAILKDELAEVGRIFVESHEKHVVFIVKVNLEGHF